MSILRSDYEPKLNTTKLEDRYFVSVTNSFNQGIEKRIREIELVECKRYETDELVALIKANINHSHSIHVDDDGVIWIELCYLLRGSAYAKTTIQIHRKGLGAPYGKLFFYDFAHGDSK